MLEGWWPGRRTAIAAGAALAIFLILLTVVLAADLGPTVLDGGITPSLHAWARADSVRWGFFAAVTHLGERIFCTVVYLVLVVVAVRRRRMAAAMWTGAVGLTYPLVSSTVKYLVDRPRPEVADPAYTFQETSFPSGHSGAAMTVAIVLICVVAMSCTGRLRVAAMAIALLIPLLVGTSRMALGVHYPTDVLAGFCLSLVWTTAMAWLVARLDHRLGWSGPVSGVVQ